MRQDRTDLVVSQSIPDVCDWNRHPLFWFYFTVYHRSLIDMQEAALKSLRQTECMCVYFV